MESSEVEKKSEHAESWQEVALKSQVVGSSSVKTSDGDTDSKEEKSSSLNFGVNGNDPSETDSEESGHK